MWAFIKTVVKNLHGIQIVSSTPISNIIQKTVWNIYKFITKGQITMLTQALSVKTHFKYFNCHLPCENHAQKFELVHRKKFYRVSLYLAYYILKNLYYD